MSAWYPPGERPLVRLAFPHEVEIGCCILDTGYLRKVTGVSCTGAYYEFSTITEARVTKQVRVRNIHLLAMTA